VPAAIPTSGNGGVSITIYIHCLKAGELADKEEWILENEYG